MTRDPLYDKIIEGLSKIQDGNLFEKCAINLLQSQWPQLVPVPGGSDDGQDGAFGSNGSVISTIGQNVIRNVAKNLNARLKAGKSGEEIIVVTSQKLSAQQANRIKKRVEELGFRNATHPYTQEAIADLLYRDPKWTMRLLGISGVAPVLSRHPRIANRFWDPNAKLVHRQNEVSQLLNSKGDVLVVGQPGVGKSALCYSMTTEHCGLFLVDDRIERVADSIRESNPAAIIVEDAVDRREIVERLVHFRGEYDQQFRIVLTGWSSDLHSLQVMLPDAELIRVESLDRSSTVEVIHDLGLRKPEFLVAEIARQSRGNPGLAATLTRAALAGNLRDEIWNGQQVLKFVKGKGSAASYQSDATPVLAALALSGGAGIRLSALSEFLKEPELKVRSILRQLNDGGIIFEKGADAMCILPAALRHALINDLLLKGIPVFDWTSILPYAADTSEVTDAVVQAFCYAYPDGEGPKHLNLQDLWRRATETQKRSTINALLWSHPVLVDRCMHDRPNLVCSHVEPCLFHRPRKTLTLLLRSSDNDDRPLNSTYQHPIRLIEDWVKNPTTFQTCLERRRDLLNVVIENRLLGQSVLRALPLVFTLEFEERTSDVKDVRTMHICSSVASNSFADELASLWQQWLDHAELDEHNVWEATHLAIRGWCRSKISKDQSEKVRSAVKLVLNRLGATNRLTNAQARALKELARFSGIVVSNVKTTQLFDCLYPDSEEWHNQKDHIERQKRHQRRLVQLAKQALAKSEEAAVRELLGAMQDAKNLHHQWPVFDTEYAGTLAKYASSVTRFINQLLLQGAPAQFIHAALRRGNYKDAREKRQIHLRVLKNSDLGIAAAEFFSCEAKMSSKERQLVVQRYLADPGWIRLHSRLDEIQPDLIAELLQVKNSTLPATLAELICHSVTQGRRWEKEILDLVFEQLKSPEFEVYHSMEFLTHTPGYHFAYLTSILDGSLDWRYPSDSHQSSLKALVKLLTTPERITLLSEKATDTRSSRLAIATLVEGDPEHFKVFLNSKSPKSLLLAPLNADINELWASLAGVALDAGWTSRDIVRASGPTMEFQFGNLSDRYKADADNWERLIDNRDPRISEIASEVAACCRLDYERALADEKKEDYLEQFG